MLSYSYSRFKVILSSSAQTLNVNVIKQLFSKDSIYTRLSKRIIHNKHLFSKVLSLQQELCDNIFLCHTFQDTLTPKYTKAVTLRE